MQNSILEAKRSIGIDGITYVEFNTGNQTILKLYGLYAGKEQCYAIHKRTNFYGSRE